MTLIVGILCEDGVVVASDRAATFGADGMSTIGQQPVRKIRCLRDSVIYSSSGAIGISQLLADKLVAMWDEKQFTTGETFEAAMGRIGREFMGVALPYMQAGAIQRQLVGEAGQSLCKSMVAIPVNKRPCLFSFDYSGSPEAATADLPFVTMGSGQPIADPFLAFLKRLLWKDCQPTVSEGRLAAVWTIQHVTQTNPGGVGQGFQLVTLVGGKGKNMPKIDEATEEDIEEHRQKVASVEDALTNEATGEAIVVEDVPPTPKPPE